jgi:ferritin
MDEKDATTNEDTLVRTSLRMMRTRRDRLKEMTRLLGFPNQDDTLAFLVDYLDEHIEDEIVLKKANIFIQKIRDERMTEKQKARDVRRRLASLPAEELERLLAQIDE